MSRAWRTLKNGIIDENPALRLVLGTCPTLAVTTAAINGLGMGLATMTVLIGANILVSLLRNVISDKVRIPTYVVIIAGFTTIVQILMQAYVPSLYSALGIYIPLIVVNCIILARAESFANKNPVGMAALDGLGMGLGYTMALFLIGAIRELIGSGSILGFAIFGESYSPMIIAILPPGGFLVFGLMIGLMNKLQLISIDLKKFRGEAERESRLAAAKTASGGSTES